MSDRGVTWDEHGMLIIDGQGFEIDVLDVVELQKWVQWALEVHGRDWAPTGIDPPVMPIPPFPAPAIESTATGD